MKWYQYDIRELTSEEYDFWYLQMQREKQRRIDRFRFAEDRCRSVAGDMLARKAIAEWCNIPISRIILSAASGGKPYVPGLAVDFSISHCGNMVVCAVDDRPIGIDIEKIRPLDLSAARHICTAQELAYLFDHTPAESEFAYTENRNLLKRFFVLWTSKEAAGKQSGVVDMRREIINDPISIHCIQDYVIAISQQASSTGSISKEGWKL